MPMMSFPPARSLAVVAALVAGGCSPPPAPPAATSAKPAAAADHGHDHDHDHRPASEHEHADDHAHDDGHDHGHDGDAHPGTLVEGVDALARAAAGLKDHLAADAHEAADEAVHGLGHLLEDVQGLVGESGLTTDAKAAATKALDDLFECFGQLDEALHAEPGTGRSPADVHASIAQRVADAIAALRAAVPVGDEAASRKERE